MTAKLLAALYESGIPIAIGIYVWMLGDRRVGKRPGESARYDIYMETHGPRLKIIGPALIAISVAGALLRAFAPAVQAN
jgi:hypothetical protein